ncbi:hypothetical protein [Halovenus salina]|uniref:High potential iron-sulfur proteins family profile domain-containing protein n=1 Tax=Halovenus salina TaxID=1510225 RepID=A0ABD5W2U6_9EURY|nr:hypothetical protein [Halovenus salina]
MGNNSSALSRRRLLTATGALSATALAGCLGSDGGGGHGDEQLADTRERPLPEGAENCVSTMGIERDPDGLTAKENVDYQYHPNYTGDSGFIELCANCQFFCPGNQFDSGIGACAAVEGGIYSQDWCALWQPVEGLEQQERSRARGSQTDT